jgi:hypothetical protein
MTSVRLFTSWYKRTSNKNSPPLLRLPENVLGGFPINPSSDDAGAGRRGTMVVAEAAGPGFRFGAGAVGEAILLCEGGLLRSWMLVSAGGCRCIGGDVLKPDSRFTVRGFDKLVDFWQSYLFSTFCWTSSDCVIPLKFYEIRITLLAVSAIFLFGFCFFEKAKLSRF